jgi:hypothetical protein
MKTITVDGVMYIPKVQTIDNYVIIRSDRAGVFAGNLKDRKCTEVELTNARRLWHWSGAASLSQLAIDGVSKPEECKFPVELPSITVLGVIEIIPCTEKAMKSIQSVPVWSV